jgi:hypothetical protein
MCTAAPAALKPQQCPSANTTILSMQQAYSVHIHRHVCLHLVECIVTAVLLPLLQALTTSVAFWYGLEAFKLRGEMVQEEVSGVEPRAWL